jgi:hypothetical protein
MRLRLSRWWIVVESISARRREHLADVDAKDAEVEELADGDSSGLREPA